MIYKNAKRNVIHVKKTTGMRYAKTDVPVSSIIVEPAVIKMKPGDEVQLSVTVLPSNASNKDVKFESFNTAFATVSDTGLVTAVMEGELSIIVTSMENSNIKASCTINISENSDPIDPSNSEYNGILIANEIMEMQVGDELGIIAHVLPYYYYNLNDYTLTSSNPSVLIADNDSKIVRALSEGEVTITATTKDGAFSDTQTFNVVKEPKFEIGADEAYVLEPNRFNIVPGAECSEEQAKINRNGFIFALEYCERMGYKRMRLPMNTYVIDPAHPITLNSNFILDLNDSTIKIIPNSYTSYSAIQFRARIGANIMEGKSMLDYDDKVTLLGESNVYSVDIGCGSFVSDFIDVKDVDVTADNQYNNYMEKGVKYTFTNRITKNVTGGSGVKFNINYYKNDQLVSKSVMSNSLWIGSSIAQYFTAQNYTITLDTTLDYNKVQFEYEIWKDNGVTGNFYVTQPSIYKKSSGVLDNSKICNGIILGERDEKANKFENWWNNGATEGCCNIVFEEGYNNGIEDLVVTKSPGFNISSGTGGGTNKSVARIGTIAYTDLEFGNFDENGNEIDDSFLVRYTKWIDIHTVTHFNLAYQLGYHGYNLLRARIADFYFYDENKNFVSRKRGKLTFREYSIPKGAYYMRVVLHTWGVLPASGDSDFGGAIGFINSFYPPTRNYIRNCEISYNYSCGFAACGGQGWIIEGNYFHNNGGRAPGCDIDWEDGWEFMQDDVVRNNKFESYNTLILCAGVNQIFDGNDIGGIITFWGRSQHYKFVNNNCYKGPALSNLNLTNMGFSAQSDRYIVGNYFDSCNTSTSNNHGGAAYSAFIIGNTYTNGGGVNMNNVSVNRDNYFYKGSCPSNGVTNAVINDGDKFFAYGPFTNCQFNGCGNLYIRDNVTFDKCKFTNCNIYSQSSVSITCNINGSECNNLSLYQTGWAGGINYIVKDSVVNNTGWMFMQLRSLGNETDRDFSIIDSELNIISTGSVFNPIQLVNNFGTLNITGCNISVEGLTYLLGGDNITSGTNIINFTNSTLTDGVLLLNSKYDGNTFITINNG